MTTKIKRNMERSQRVKERKAREKVEIKKIDLQKDHRMIQFNDANTIDGEKFMDPEHHGYQKITVSLNNDVKYISLYDGEVGLRFYLTDEEAKLLLQDKFLHIAHQYTNVE